MFKNYGAEGLKSHKTGPKSHYRRTHEVVRQVIRYRYLDPNISPEVIAQKLNQNGFPIAIRSVERVLAGCPEDQTRNLVKAQIWLQERQLVASAAARLCDRPDGPTAIGYGRGPGAAASRTGCWPRWARTTG